MQEQSGPSSASRSVRSARFFNYLHRYKKLLQKRWWVLPITLAIGLGVQGYRVWKAPPVYMAVGRMIVSYRMPVQTGPVATEELLNFLGTQRELMKSIEVQERAVERLKLKPSLKPVPVMLQVSVSPKTTIFNLTATGTEPNYTVAYLDACMAEYRALKREMKVGYSDEALAGIMDNLGLLEKDLKKLEEEEIAFKTTNSIVFIQEQENSTAKYLSGLTTKLAQKQTEFEMLTRLNLDQNLMRQQKGDTTPGIGADSVASSEGARLLNNDYFRAKQELDLRRAELERWEKDLKPKHPRIIALKEEITRREDLVEIFKGQSMVQLTNQVNTVALEMETLKSQIKEWEVKSLTAATNMAVYNRIKENKTRVQNLFDQLQKNLQTIGVDKNINQESVTLHSRARLVPAPNTAIMSLTIGAVVGLIAGLAILLLVERLDDRPASFTDLQDLFDEPVLGQIPFEHSPGSKNGAHLLRPDDRRHAFLEAYRNLRSSLLYMANEGKRPRVMCVTSAIPGDGKSMTAANFAIIMASSGSRVVLVDADLRKGLLHRHFKLEPAPGLNEILLGKADWRSVVQPTSTANLFVIPRGETAQNPGEMFLSDASLKLIKELSAEYDYVIFDTAPVMAADDVTSLSPHVEGVIFVIRAGYTSGRVARAALDLLYQREVSVLGLAFNGVETNASEYYYYRYKDYYADHKSS